VTEVRSTSAEGPPPGDSAESDEVPYGARMEGHGGELAVAVARRYGVETMYTLSGAHVFPLYDAAVKGDPALRLVDVRHEQTAVFAAEATAKLTRTPGLAVLTAGPGVTNGISAVTTAHFNGSAVVVLGGRAPAWRWGSGSLQELDHPPLLAPVTKLATTARSTESIPERVDDAFRTATSPHRGPVFLDVAMDHLYSRAEVALPPVPVRRLVPPDSEMLADVAAALAQAERPVLVLGSDVWADGAEEAARRAADAMGVPVVANGMGRGILPAGHPQLVTKARSLALGQADLVIVVGAPLDFRLGYGSFGGKQPAASSAEDSQHSHEGPPARVIHLADSSDQVARHVALAAAAYGDLSLIFDGLIEAWEQQLRRPAWERWLGRLADAVTATAEKDAEVLGSDADPIHPARIYGELVRRLDNDAVVIGDGGDFVSFAGKYIEPRHPGGWLDPGPYGCLGTGLGYAIAARLARPSSQVVLMLGDGAAGFSLMDVDTLVRHGLPVVMVVGNNGCWGLEKHPMRFLYGYDVAADLAPQTRYDSVVSALGGAGELVTAPSDIGPALDRAFAADVPYLINVITDPAVIYPRTTTGI
jgi:thiamine pyrophosphate-dependent acetolactate synthase large subunit-like protein